MYYGGGFPAEIEVLETINSNLESFISKIKEPNNVLSEEDRNFINELYKLSDKFFFLKKYINK